MGKISSEVSSGLNAAIQEAIEKVKTSEEVVGSETSSISTSKDVLNSGVIANKKRKKKQSKKEVQSIEDNSLFESLGVDTPKNNEDDKDKDIIKTQEESHIIAIVNWDTKDKVPTKVEIPDSILVDEYDINTVTDYLNNIGQYCCKDFQLTWPRTHKDTEEFCKWELEKARLRGLPDPDFDFRNFYSKGQIIYFIHVLNGNVKTKELKRLSIRTIYPRMMVCNEEKACCLCVDYKSKDFIFDNIKDASDIYKTIHMAEEKEQNTGKSKAKDDNGILEGIDDEISEYDEYRTFEDGGK